MAAAQRAAQDSEKQLHRAVNSAVAARETAQAEGAAALLIAQRKEQDNKVSEHTSMMLLLYQDIKPSWFAHSAFNDVSFCHENINGRSVPLS